MSKPQNPVAMAVIGAAHGIKGEVRVKSFTADPLALGDYGALHAADGRRFEVQAIRPADTVVIVRFKGIADRNAAEALAGTELFVDRSALPPEDEDEFYHADLAGLTVRDETGATVGKVTAVQNFGGGDLLDIVHQGRRGVLIPFTRAAVPTVDVASGFVTIDTAAAGLGEDPDEAEARAAGEATDRSSKGPKSNPRDA